MHISDDSDHARGTSHLRAVIASRMRQRSWAELSRAIDVPQLAVKLDTATAADRLPPFDLLVRIIGEVDVTFGELVGAAVADSTHPELMPPITHADALMMRRLLRSTPAVRRMVSAWLDVMAELDGLVPDVS
jgi:hypothetical protein